MSTINYFHLHFFTNRLGHACVTFHIMLQTSSFPLITSSKGAMPFRLFLIEYFDYILIDIKIQVLPILLHII